MVYIYIMFIDNIEKLTLKNENYRQVISTNNNMQVVLMSLKPKEEIGTLNMYKSVIFI